MSPGWLRNGLVVTTAVAGLAVAMNPSAVAAQVMDDHIYSMILIDQLEMRQVGGQQPIGWQASAWVGGDLTRIWLKSEGEIPTTARGGRAEAQTLFSRLISPFWEFQAGLRIDARREAGGDRARLQAAVGFEGLAPYWFDVEPVLFVSTAGDISARVEATHDMFITQRLLLQPRVDVNIAVQKVPDYGVGSGLNDLDVGFRLRYEIRREFSPYIGFRWERRFAGTADLARQAGEHVSITSLLGGVRFWF